MDYETLQANAIHEAGHAVALYLLFDLDELHRIGELKIGENWNFFCVIDMAEPTAEEEEKEAIMYCAGYAALIVAKYSEDEALKGTESDFERAKAKSSKSIDSLKNAAIDLLSSERAKLLVMTLSERLISEMTVSATDLQDFFLVEDLA